MPTPQIRAALSAWRMAERRWRTTPAHSPAYRTMCLQVIDTWLVYQELVHDHESFVLVADDQRRYVAVSDSVRDALGYDPSELLGRTTDALMPTDLAPDAESAWRRFLHDGADEGEYRLRAKGQAEVAVRFEARADLPIPGYHALRSWPITPASTDRPRLTNA